jgi:thiol:disulfide interchange protein
MTLSALRPLAPGLVMLAAVAVASSTACGNAPAPQDALAPPNTAQPVNAAPYVPVSKYDPGRDPDKDVQLAVVEARRTGKRILLEVGGEWCSWCHIMDAYFEQNPVLLDARERNFVTLKINVSEENENTKFFSKYPKVAGYPHLFVLDSDGKFLHSQGTAELESGKSYDFDRFSAFLQRWARAS